MTCLALYLLSCIPFYGAYFAYWQRNYPLVAQDARKIDRRVSIAMSLFWPTSVWAYILSDRPFQGFKFF